MGAPGKGEKEGTRKGISATLNDVARDMTGGSEGENERINAGGRVVDGL